MLYSDYLNAARKHLITCELLKENICQINTSNTQEKTKCKQLSLNLYYLTGYVFECSIKYGIYKVIDHDPKSSVKSLDTPLLSYEKHIKHHPFKYYSDHLINKSPGIKLVDDTFSIPRDVVYLYNTWNAEIRYWYRDIGPSMEKKLTTSNLSNLLAYAEQAFKHVSRL
jgi:hypothetical protein